VSEPSVETESLNSADSRSEVQTARAETTTTSGGAAERVDFVADADPPADVGPDADAEDPSFDRESAAWSDPGVDAGLDAGADPVVDGEVAGDADPDADAQTGAGAGSVVDGGSAADADPGAGGGSRAGADPVGDADAAAAAVAAVGGDPVADGDPAVGVVGADPVTDGVPGAGTGSVAGTRAADEQAPGEGAPPVQAELDELADPERLRSALEAVLLVVDTPTSSLMLAQVLGRSVPEVEAALRSLRDEYDAGGRGTDLREVADGWRLYSRDEFAGYVERFILDGQQARLTQASLETLAVIAYRQPVTRGRISGIRGVSVDAVMRTLLTRGLVEECGADPDTGGGLYRTTRLFLEKMGLRSLDELPSLAPLLPDTSQLDDVELST
jgi:segregation and condensation protein B